MKKGFLFFLSFVLLLGLLNACILPEESTAPQETTAPESTPEESDTASEETTAPEDAAAPLFSAENYPLIDGSTATKPLAKAFYEEFTGLTSPEIKHSKTHQAYLNLIDGTVDLILVVEPSADETAYAEEKGVTLELTKVTNDAFVFFVNKTNPVDSLSVQQIRDIYSGKITNWKEVGGANLEIAAYQRPENSGSQTGMQSLVMGDTEMAEPVKGHIADSMSDIVDVVSSFDSGPAAIGYSYYYYAKTMYIGENVKMIAVEGVKPNNTTICDADYPIMTYYYAVTRKDDRSPETEELLNAMLSGRGQIAARDAGYVPTKFFDTIGHEDNNPEKTEERTLHLSDTYTVNGIRSIMNEGDCDGLKFNYISIEGLKDAAIEKTINDEIYADALENAKKIRAFYDADRDNTSSYALELSSIANTLSVSAYVAVYHMEEDKYVHNADVIYSCFDLETGKRLSLYDLFKSDVKAADILGAEAYSNLLYVNAEVRPNDEKWWELVITDYKDVEEELLALSQKINAREDIPFSFDAQAVTLHFDLLSGEACHLKLYFTDMMESTVLFSKYGAEKDIYSGVHKTMGQIPVLVKRYSPLDLVFEKTDDYLLDAALYAGSYSEDFRAAEKGISAVFNEMVEERRTAFEEAAKNGKYTLTSIFINGYHSENPKKYAFRFDVTEYTLTADSRETFENYCEEFLRAVREEREEPFTENLALMQRYDENGNPRYDIETKRGALYFNADGELALRVE